MTILGCIDFRSAGLPNHNSDDASDVLLFADGRISVSGGNGKLTDAAPKLQVLDICVFDKHGGVKRSAITVGFAGTSALAAMSAIAFASNVLRHLSGADLPTVPQIGSFVAHAFRAALEEYSVNQMRAVDAALIVAGFDNSVQKTVVQAMYFKPRLGTYQIEFIPNQSYLTIVSGPAEWDLKKRLNIQLPKQTQESWSALLWNATKDIEEALRAIAERQPFGGQLQLCTVDIRGPRLLPTQFWDLSHRRPDLPSDWNEGDFRTTLLGYEISDLRVGQCDFLPHGPIPLPDVTATPWAKGGIPCEQRPLDDGDLFSRPRTGVLLLRPIKKD